MTVAAGEIEAGSDAEVVPAQSQGARGSTLRKGAEKEPPMPIVDGVSR